MARKGVNLLEGDDEERGDDPEGDSGDDGGSDERRRGGFVDVLMVILFVCVMLGGVAWAGYQFWWLPKMEQEAALERTRVKQAQAGRMRLVRMRDGAERAQQPPSAAPRQFDRTNRVRKQDKNLSVPDRLEHIVRLQSAAKPEFLVVAVPKQATAPRRVPVEKPPSSAVVMGGKPGTPPRMKEKPRREAAAPKAQMPEKRKPIVRKSPQGFSYSVQVASCRTERCAASFSKRLKRKGYSAFKVTSTSRMRKRRGQITEVRLGSFAKLDEARALASRARKNKIGARVYRSNNRWRVAAGSFRNLEDAAVLLDRAEDLGFRGALASRIQSGGAGRLYRIRTGKFSRLRDALALRKKIRGAGFSDAIVVRQRSRK